MHDSYLASHIRSYRKKAGLSQNELARILDLDEAQVSRHERADVEPPLSVVLAYEAVFGVPVKDLYPRFYAGVKQGIEERLIAMEFELQKTSGEGRRASAIARKLEWLCERRDKKIIDTA